MSSTIFFLGLISALIPSAIALECLEYSKVMEGDLEVVNSSIFLKKTENTTELGVATVVTCQKDEACVTEMSRITRNDTGTIGLLKTSCRAYDQEKKNECHWKESKKGDEEGGDEEIFICNCDTDKCVNLETAESQWLEKFNMTSKDAAAPQSPAHDGQLLQPPPSKENVTSKDQQAPKPIDEQKIVSPNPPKPTTESNPVAETTDNVSADEKLNGSTKKPKIVVLEPPAVVIQQKDTKTTSSWFLLFFAVIIVAIVLAVIFGFLFLSS